jgi:HTH-like domain
MLSESRVQTQEHYEADQENALNLELMRRIDAQYLKTLFDGYRRMTVYLCEQGFAVNPKRVQRLMHTVMGIQALYPKPHNRDERGPPCLPLFATQFGNHAP